MKRALVCCIAFAAFALALTAKSAAASMFSGLHWRSIGPAVSGGRVSAVAGSDRQPFLYYIGGADGGVFKTTNGGDSWTAVFADKPVASIGAIAISPSNPNDVWVGTGEGNPRDIVSYGDGVWRSTDGARHWTHLGLDGTSQITSILVDPRHPQVALVGALGNPFADSADRGVFRTTDGGKTWRKTLYVGPSTGVSDLAWDPRHPHVVFAGMWQYRRLPWNIISGGPQSGLYRSRDGGVHWEKLSGNGLPSGLIGRIGIAVAPNHPNRVYAIIQSKQGYVWRSNDGGNTWHKTRATSIVDERPFYFTHLFVDPTNQGHIYAVSVELSQSYDAGETFKTIEHAENVDNHAMWFSADGGRIMVAHDAGWELSTDGGRTWDWRTNVALGQVYHVGYDLQNPYNVYSGLQDAESWIGPSNSLNPDGILNRDWLSLNGGDGTWAWPDPLDPHLIWNDTEIGELGIFDTRTRQTVDIWPYPHDTNAIGVAGLPYRFNWQAPIAFSPQDGHVMYFGGNVVFETKDRGQSWQTISPDLTLNDRRHQQTPGGPITIEGAGVEFYDAIVDIAPSVLAAGEIWVSTDDGLIQLTRDGGATWRNVSPKGVPGYGRVSTVEASHALPATAYATIDRHMLGDRTPYIVKTDDYGATWRRITAGLPPHQYAHVVREDPANPSVLYAGLEQGIWVSFDGGRRWQSLQLDLATSSVRDIQIQPQANDLIAATLGRSLWILDDLTPLQALDRAKASGAFLYQPRSAYAFSLWETEQPGWSERPPLGQFAGENPSYGAIVSYYLPRREAHVKAQILDAAGRIVRHLGSDDGVTGAIGVNRFSWDLAEDPPVAWHGTPKWNVGPDDGPEAVPGRYTVKVMARSTVRARTFDVLADPRAEFTQAQYEERHRFLQALFAQLSAVDAALNALDSMRRQMTTCRRQAERRGDRTMVRAIQRASGRLGGVFSALTSNPQASQDSDFLPDQLRERIQFVIALVSSGSSYLGPPLAPQYKEAAGVSALYEVRMSAYRRFVKEDVDVLNAALQRSGYAPIR